MGESDGRVLPNAATLLKSATAGLATIAAAGPAHAETARQMAGERAFVQLGLQVREALERTLPATADFPERAAAALSTHSPGGSLSWIWATLIVLAGAFAAGGMVLAVTERWMFARFLQGRLPHPGADRSTRIAFLFSRAILMALAIVPFAAVTMAVAFAFVSGHPASRVSVFIGVEASLTLLALRLVLRTALAPGVSHGRMISFSDPEATSLYRGLMAAGGLSILMMSICDWMEAMGLDPAPHRLALIATIGATCLLLSLVAIAHRRSIGRIVSGGQAASSRAHRIAGLVWLPLILVYFALAFLTSGVRILLEKPDAIGLVAAPIMAALVWGGVLGLMILIVDRLLLPRLDSDQKLETRVRDLMRADTAAGEPPEEEAARSQAAAEAMEAERHRLPYRNLLDHGAEILAVVIAIGFILMRWGVHIADKSSIASILFEVGVIVFLSYMAYQAVELAIDRQIHRESGTASGHGEAAEGHGRGESRLATLLPIFRNFLLISIVVLGGMIVLSEFGVNVGPLFAGAGVVGLAVGFGSQTLIRDIFSGAFFLVDDAFRKGEYIDIGSVKGTVEKISIRSMQLRHHNGPLNTVPFGEIKFVKNFSRDWAVMKLAFRVTYDTDVDKMRKLIKKFGQELLEHPDYGSKFLEPVKSQGVTALEDSAMIVRVKFMTRPGDQFELRKVVYSGIRDLCEAAGIHFAHREVTVRVAQEPGDTREFNEAEKKAIGAAVLPTLAPAGPPPDADGR
jgi:small-conductance mechanosensitive channel